MDWVSGFNWADFWRDPAWAAVGVLVAVVATFFAWWAVRAAWNRKALTYEIVANVPLLTVRQRTVNGLELLFKGLPIKDAQLVIVRLANTGRTAIESGHFEQKLSIVFDGGVNVLAADISSADPDDLLLQASVQIDEAGDAVHLAPLLLNAGDSFECKMVIDREAKAPQIFGRVVGVRKVTKATDRPLLWLGGAFLPLVASIVVLQMAPRVTVARPTPDPIWLRVSVVLAAISFVVLLVRTYSRLPRSRRNRLRRWIS